MREGRVKRKDDIQSGDDLERKRVYKPPVDIIETEDDVLLFADMPGVDAESVDINLDRDLLTIYGKVKDEAPEKARLLFSEYDVGDYERSFVVSKEIDTERISASLQDGVLKLTLPKAKAFRPIKVPVRAA